MPDPTTVNLVDLDGVARPVPSDQVKYWTDRGWHPETGADAAARTVADARDDMYGGIGGKAQAAAAGVARGATFGLSDVAARTFGDEDLVGDLRGVRDANPGISTAAEIAGTFLPGGAGSIASKAGTRLAGAGGGTIAELARAGVRGATEGALLGAGQGASEVALSEDPIDFERAASVIGSNALWGAAPGAGLGIAGKAIEKGLVRAKTALDDAATAARTAEGVPEDLASLDAKGLRGAKDAEIERLVGDQAQQRSAQVDSAVNYRNAVKEANPWLAISEGENASLLNKSDRTLRNALNDPKGLRENPGSLLKPLRVQEQAFERAIADRASIAAKLESANTRIATDLSEELATLPEKATHVEISGKTARRYGAYADVKVGKDAVVKLAREDAQTFLEALQRGEVKGASDAALDKLDGLLQANRDLQANIAKAVTPKAELVSDRLKSIADASDALVGGGKPKQSLAQEMLGGSIYGHVAGAFSGLPIVGPMIGAKAAKLASSLVEGKLGVATKEAAQRASKAVQTFLDVGRKIAPAAPVLATKVLSNVAYAPTGREKRPDKKAAPTLASAFKARSEEVRSHVEPGPDGSLQMRSSSRAQIAARLAPIAAVHPVLADSIESIQARKMEFLASKLPRRPDVGGIPVGPDKWQPSDMEMRTWARYVSAVEDPHGVVERLAAGSITPEDVQAITTVYPELHADIARQVIEQLPTLRGQLPYQRRLALSMFTGVAVDPALDPKVLRILQGSFSAEEGTEGGTQAPRPNPQFGSVTKDEPTPAQQRGR